MSEARYAVYLVDPGPNRPALLVLLQEVLGLNQEAAAEYVREFPSLISFHETEGAARNLAERFRDFDAVAVVRPADQPLAPAPVEDPAIVPGRPAMRWLLAALCVVQLGVSILWFTQGRLAAAGFGIALGALGLLYVALCLRR